jgi:hypothetical protein
VIPLCFFLAATCGLAGAQQKSPESTDAAEAALRTDAPGEFFLISSINAEQYQLVLKRPTEVTQLARVDQKTRYLDAQGKPMRLTDLRAGDTVYVVLQASGTGEPLAMRIQQGPMTVERLHRGYVQF